MYGPDPADLIGHLGYGEFTPGAEGAEEEAIFRVFDSVRDDLLAASVDMTLDWLAENSIVDEDSARAALFMLESVPDATVPDGMAVLEGWRHDKGEEVIGRLADAYDLCLSALDGAPLDDGSDDFDQRVFRLQMSLMEAASIAMRMLESGFSHYIAHLADDVGYVFTTDAEEDPYGDGLF